MNYKYLAIPICLLILTSNILLISLNDSFYINKFSEYNVYDNFNSNEEVNNNFTLTLNYLNNKNELNEDFYTQKEILHLKDVKTLITITKIIFILSLISLIFYKNKTNLIKSINLGSKYTVIVLIILGLLFTFKFQNSFVYFHKIFFFNNLWILSPESNLIRIFPTEIFKDLILRIIKYSFTTAIILLIITSYIKR